MNITRNARGRVIVPKHLFLEERLALEARSDTQTGCILWGGHKTRGGYGHIRWNGRAQYTHRLAWINKHGDIPPGIKVCHRCDVPACINPDHLFLGTDADNRADCVAKGRQAKGEAIARRMRGENSPVARLTDRQVLAIRAATGPQRQIASAFGVCQMTVSNIKRRKLWAHLED